MVVCVDDAEANQVNRALNVQRAKQKPAGSVKMMPCKSGVGSGLSPPTKQKFLRGWNLLPRTAARFFSVAESDLAAWRDEGVGPFHLQYENGAVRYQLGELAAWLADGFHDQGESWNLLVAAGAVSADVSAQMAPNSNAFR